MSPCYPQTQSLQGGTLPSLYLTSHSPLRHHLIIDHYWNHVDFPDTPFFRVLNVFFFSCYFFLFIGKAARQNQEALASTDWLPKCTQLSGLGQDPEPAVQSRSPIWVSGTHPCLPFQLLLHLGAHLRKLEFGAEMGLTHRSLLWVLPLSYPYF